ALAWLFAAAMETSVGNFIPGFAVTSGIALTGIALMLALGHATGLIPAINGMGLNISTAPGRSPPTRAFLLPIIAPTLSNIKRIPQRFWLSLSTVVAVALVVMVLLSLLAMANGFQRTLASSGANDVAIVLRGGSQAEINSTV